MDVKEVLKRKSDLALLIKETIELFEEETETYVESINIDRVAEHRYGNGPLKIIVAVNIKVKI